MNDVLTQVGAAAQWAVERLRWAGRQTHDWADAELAAALVGRIADGCLERLVATGCWGEANRVPSSRLWQIAGEFLDRGRLQRQARFKPRGYAGDYELLARIGRQELCDDPLGRAFDRFFQQQAACRAVRARFAMTAAALAEHFLGRAGHEWDRGGGAYNVLSVGSGPALDLLEAAGLLAADDRRRLRLTLVDLDPDALDWAAGQLGTLLPAEAIVPQRANLFRLPRREPRELFPQAADFVICSGLFDYLADDAAAEFLAWLWAGLAPGGRLLVCNFSTHNPSRAYMEWIGNWYLIYRSAEQMRALIAQAGLPPGAATLCSEPLGVIWFITAGK